MTIDSFWDYELDLYPLTGLGGYDQAVWVFGGRDALDLVLGTLNLAVSCYNGPSYPTQDADNGGLAQTMSHAPELRRAIDWVGIPRRDALPRVHDRPVKADLERTVRGFDVLIATASQNLL